MDPGQFIRGLPLLRIRLARNFISEKIYRIRNRIDLTDFYNAYMVAQNNPNTFLQHSAKEIFGKGRYVVARTGRKSSIVKQRLIDILFSESPVFKPKAQPTRKKWERQPIKWSKIGEGVANRGQKLSGASIMEFCCLYRANWPTKGESGIILTW